MANINCRPLTVEQLSDPSKTWTFNLVPHPYCELHILPPPGQFTSEDFYHQIDNAECTTWLKSLPHNVSLRDGNGIVSPGCRWWINRACVRALLTSWRLLFFSSLPSLLCYTNTLTLTKANRCLPNWLWLGNCLGWRQECGWIHKHFTREEFPISCNVLWFI